MSTQNRNSGGGGGGTVRNQKKSNANNGSIGNNETITHAASNNKKSEVTKTEKEKIQPKPTPEQLRIAQITNSNAAEDPQMREKVATLLEMTQRSEEEVCCALYECDNNMERAVVFLLETLPVGAFETSSKKKKKQAAAVAGQDGTTIGGGGGGNSDDWNDGNVNSSSDKREKSRNRSSNRGGRGGTDSRGWRGREARENERNLRESRSSGFGGGFGNGERDDRGTNREDRGGPRGNGMSSRRGGEGGGRGGGYAARTGRGGGRMGGRMSGLGRSDRGPGGGTGSGVGSGSGNYGHSRQNTTNDEHHEVELWDNTIAQNAEKQNHTQDDAWGDWDNEEYVGSLKDSKVFTTSNLPNQTTASVVSGGLQIVPGNDALSAPPGLESHLGGGGGAGVPISPNVGVNDDSLTPIPTTPMQYSAALTGGTPVQQQQPQQQQQQAVQSQQQVQQHGSVNATNSGLNVNAPQYNNVIADTFTNAANAAANLVQQVQAQQQAQTQLKATASATLSAEQSQYFNSLTSQNAAGVLNSTGVVVAQQQLTPQINTYAQSAATAVAGTVAAAAASGVQYPTIYANVFGTTAPGENNNTTPVGLDNQQQPMQQVRRPRAKLPPPSKIPATAVEMPGDSLNNMGYIDVQFGGLDFGTDDSFDALSDKFNTSVTIDNQSQQQQQQQQQQQAQQQLVQTGQDVNANDYQNKAGVVVAQQQTSLTAGLQNAQISDALSGGYATQRGATVSQQQQQQQQQPQVVGNNQGSVATSTLEHLTKNDHVYNQANVNNTGGYQSAYQASANNKVANNAYQQSTVAQAYNSNAYNNVQASVANSYQAQAFSSYQQNAVNSYQQQAVNSVPGTVNNGTVSSNSSQNIPVGGSNSNNAT